MKRIPLTKGKFALVDDEDYKWLNQWKWHAFKQKTTNCWYARRIINTYEERFSLGMHRDILKPKKENDCDHIDGNGLNNRRSNLRECTRSQNSQNQVSTCGSSKYKGVCWDKDKKKWLASIYWKGKNVYLARTNNEEDSAIYYNVAAQFLFGEFARLNNV